MTRVKGQVKKFFFQLFPVLKFKVLEESMMPALMPGRFVVAERFTYLFRMPKVGEIVILRSPLDKKLLVKRVVDVYDGLILVLGDNLASSIDSRDFGLIRKKDIIAKVINQR